MTNEGGTLPYGKTLEDVGAMAFRAVLFMNGSPLTIQDQRELARDTIVELLCSDLPVDVRDPDGYLVRSAQNAIRNAHNRALIEGLMGGRSDGLGSRASAYWYGSRGYVPDFSDDVLEALAVRQAWDQLPLRHREALALYVQHENGTAAALAAGMSRTGYYGRLTEARRAMRKLLDAPGQARRVRLRRRGARVLANAA